MSIIHISKQRMDFIRSCGWALGYVDGDTQAVYHEGDTSFHEIDSEIAYCPRCSLMMASVDANDPAELEIIKMTTGSERTITALRDHRQQSIVFMRGLLREVAPVEGAK